MKSTLITLILLFTLVSCSGDHGGGYEFMPNMTQSVAYEAFASSSLTSDGKSMMQPVKGTISRGHMPYSYPKTFVGAQKAGVELSDPFPTTEHSLARGAHIFKTFCAVCHGVAGKGDGVIIPKFPQPPPLDANHIKAYPKGRLYHIITLGSVIMPSHAQQILPRDRWYLAQYIKENIHKK
ncbi:MAG: cytochrome c [Bdellovibrionales bacterium]|jgi:mono/diheme cytochrome c family protein|nr:cytochrome c [Bdellovibrionales bacterium]MBT3527052.1 cytochrome c [Bdellovibrionales bacterium]MBT7668820.1 cytochrome c [Bdellovibrionales bacterium]MBT7765589.1 cytochrome c [Bdellovibrionales bacterium]